MLTLGACDMWAYIKDRKTFATLLQRPVSNWSVCLDSIDLQTSTVTLACDDLPPTMARNWMVLDGRVYLIDKLQTTNGLTKATLLPPWALFDREVVFTSGAQSMGRFVLNWIYAGWINQSDTEYKAAYITATNTDTTSYQDPDMDDNGVFSIREYILTARRKGVDIAAQMSGSGLAVAISKHTAQAHTLVDGDGHTQLITNTIGGGSVAKVTVVQPVSGSVTQTVWYLAADGSISTSVPAQRAQGDWATIEIAEDDDQQTAVQELVDGNARSYKVEFFSDVDMAVGDTYRMRLNGAVFDGIITAKFQSGDDSRIRYSSGDLATTLTERVDKLGG